MPIVCEKWTPRRSNTLHGFCDVLLTETHLRIHDIALHEKNGKRWVSLPAKPQINREGLVLKDERGKVKYAPVLAFEDRATADKFSTACIAAVIERHPGVFNDEAAA
jgi:hypothetical protein